ncbi:MAG TPA: adenylate/guanylate cyclase domain-containing protein [Planctomycetota bacterium]|nr:adenylate/guanylate cyclase domain-containing protein [Planctomycetota bacterium]
MAARKELPKLVQALLAGAGVAILAILVHSTEILRPLELKTQDLRMRWTKPPKGDIQQFDHPEIAVMDITDDSLAWFTDMDQKHRTWPWPRDVISTLFRGCAMGKARVILFDMFTHIDLDAQATESEWAKDILAGPPSYFAVPFSLDPNERADKRKDLDALLKKYAIEVDTDGSVEISAPYASVQLSQPAIAQAIAGISDVKTPRDIDDIIRKYRLLVRFRGHYYPSFALAGLMVREQVKSVQIRNGILRVGRLSIPLEREGLIGLRFYEKFTAMYASPVIAGVWSIEDEKKITSFDPAKVKDRIVVIGTSAAQLFDLKASPVGERPGCEMHATAIRNILQGEILREAPYLFTLLSTVALALGAALATRFSSAVVGASGAVGLLTAYTGSSLVAFSNHWIIELVIPVMAIVLSYAATSAVNFLNEGRQRMRIKRDFQSYVSPKVVEKILANPDALSLKGERKTLTMFFMDFAGFTSMSELLDPLELVALISEYHNEAAEEIFKTEGTIDKYMGDAIMAFWNDPIAQADHALRACLTAINAQKRLRQMAIKMKERGLPEMRARIGINTGVATVGNMGAKHQVGYTVIGDEVNLASRLEGVNKEFGTEIIISEAACMPAKEKLDVRELALIKVKGKKVPVRIFELIGVKGEAPADRLERAKRFEEAFAEFQARRFSKAWEMFLSLTHKGDRPSEVYVSLCERYMSDPPPPDWDGSYQMEHK